MCKKWFKSVHMGRLPIYIKYTILCILYFTLLYHTLHILHFHESMQKPHRSADFGCPVAHKMYSGLRKCLLVAILLPNHSKMSRIAKKPQFSGGVYISGMGRRLAAEINIPIFRPIENMLIVHKQLKTEGLCSLNTYRKPCSPDKMATSFLVSDAPWRLFRHSAITAH